MPIHPKKIYASGMNDHELKYIARRLRSNMTPHEDMLWQKIRRKQLHGLQFYRQKRIAGYIVDFYCAEKMLVIEIDGAQHHSAQSIRYDSERTRILKAKGLSVLRFDNLEIEHDMGSVVFRIKSWVEEHPSQPPF